MRSSHTVPTPRPYSRMLPCQAVPGASTTSMLSAEQLVPDRWHWLVLWARDCEMCETM